MRGGGWGVGRGQIYLILWLREKLSSYFLHSAVCNRRKNSKICWEGRGPNPWPERTPFHMPNLKMIPRLSAPTRSESSGYVRDRQRYCNNAFVPVAQMTSLSRPSPALSCFYPIVSNYIPRFTATLRRVFVLTTARPVYVACIILSSRDIRASERGLQLPPLPPRQFNTLCNPRPICYRITRTSSSIKFTPSSLHASRHSLRPRGPVHDDDNDDDDNSNSGPTQICQRASCIWMPHASRDFHITFVYLCSTYYWRSREFHLVASQTIDSINTTLLASIQH